MALQSIKNLLKDFKYSRKVLQTISRYSTAESISDADTPIDEMKNPFEKPRQQCILCQMNLSPNYKNVRLLSQFQSPYTGRIYGRHITGLCKHKQELIEKEIKKSQEAGIMPTYYKLTEFLKDPPLFDPERPIRPHKY